MNINCPKCGFNQPDDQYCANCGVDMTKFEPQKKPLWQRIVGNWIFQLGVLILVVILLVARDIIFPPQKRVSIAQRDLPPIEQRSFRRSEEGDGYAQPAVTPPPMPTQAKKVEPPPMRNRNAKVAESEASKPKLKPLKKRIGAFLYLAQRDQLEMLASQGEFVDEGVIRVSAKKFAKALKTFRAEWKKVGSQGQNFEFAAPNMIFFGSPGSDGKNLGIFARSVVAEGSTVKELTVEIRSWSDMKAKGEPIEGPGLTTTLPRTDILIFTGIIPREMTFNEAEKKAMAADPVLSAATEPRFLEDYADLVLVLQFK